MTNEKMLKKRETQKTLISGLIVILTAKHHFSAPQAKGKKK